MGGLPISRLALDPSRGATPLAQWCSVLASPKVGLNCLNNLGIDLAHPAASDNDVTLVTLALAGANFDVLPLNEIVVTGTINVGPGAANVLGDSPLGVASINDLDLDAAGIGHIGIGHIGIGHIGIGHIGIGHIGIGHIGIGHIGLNETGIGHIDLDAAGIGHIGIGHIGIGHIGVGHIGIGHISLGTASTGATGVGHIGVGHIDLAQSGVGHIALADLTDATAVVDCSTPAVFDCSVGTPTLSDVPPALLRGTLWDLFQVLAPTSPSFTAFQNLTIADIINALLAGTTEGDTISLTELIASLLVDSQTTIADLVANSTDAQAVELGTLLNGITADKQNETTLGELLAGITDPAVAATTLAELLAVIANDLGITVEDLLIGLLGNSDLPWEQLDLGAVALQPFAQPGGDAGAISRNARRHGRRCRQSPRRRRHRARSPTTSCTRRRRPHSRRRVAAPRRCPNPRSPTPPTAPCSRGR